MGKLEGNTLLESSRMMLPEHVEANNNNVDQQGKRERKAYLSYEVHPVN